MSQINYSIYRNVLRLVAELHLRGYQGLRIAPGMSPSGMNWRCSITPVTNISVNHGAKMVDWNGLAFHYTTSLRTHYFEDADMPYTTPSHLANLFVKRYPELVEAGKGSDWSYAGWYVEMLHLTYPNSFPIAYADWEVPDGYLMTTGERTDIRIPMPPPGLGKDAQ